MRFVIEPNVGALPIALGSSSAEVHALLGSPERVTTLWGKSGTAEFWLNTTVNVGDDNDGIARHVGFGPGDFELLIRGMTIWAPHNGPAERSRRE